MSESCTSSNPSSSCGSRARLISIRFTSTSVERSYAWIPMADPTVAVAAPTRNCRLEMCNCSVLFGCQLEHGLGLHFSFAWSLTPSAIFVQMIIRVNTGAYCHELAEQQQLRTHCFQLHSEQHRSRVSQDMIQAGGKRDPEQ